MSGDFGDYIADQRYEDMASNPELKVSEKVRELALDAWNVDCLQRKEDIPRLEKMIQSSLSELLEAGRKIKQLMVSPDFDLMDMSDAIMNFAAILSNWEPK